MLAWGTPGAVSPIMCTCVCVCVRAITERGIVTHTPVEDDVETGVDARADCTPSWIRERRVGRRVAINSGSAVSWWTSSLSLLDPVPWAIASMKRQTAKTEYLVC